MSFQAQQNAPVLINCPFLRLLQYRFRDIGGGGWGSHIRLPRLLKRTGYHFRFSRLPIRYFSTQRRKFTTPFF